MKLKNQGGRPSKRPSNEELEKLYIQDGLTGSQIAQKFGVKEPTVRGWIYKIRKAERGGNIGK